MQKHWSRWDDNDCQRAYARIERLRAPWRAVDDMDWDYVMGSLGHGGRDRFWKAVLTEMRAALAP